MNCLKCKGKNNLFKNNTTSSGKIQYLCRECNTERIRKYAKTNIGKLNRRKAVYKSIDKYRYKQNARMLVYQAIRRGELCKPNKCENCLKIKELFLPTVVLVL